MNNYALVQRLPEGTKVVATTQATTQGKAERRLYRAKRIDATDARKLGYSVEFQKLPKEQQNAQVPF